MKTSPLPRDLSSSPSILFAAVAVFLAFARCNAFTESFIHNGVKRICIGHARGSHARRICRPGACRELRKPIDSQHSLYSSRLSSTALTMGLFDFLHSRQGDFIPLRSSDDDAPYGPGPLILLYAVPKSIGDDELRDMAQDGMSGTKGVVIRRIDAVVLDGNEGRETKDDDLLDLTVQEALDTAFKEGGKLVTPVKTDNAAVVSMERLHSEDEPCPVLYFSGVTNSQMMSTYRIMANEIYQETNGMHWPACAKVVRPAMQKTLRQVLMEISGDHADAMRMKKGDSEISEEG
ncbi:hypothetical protein ACHAW6_009447 [Cyclotella cf. meneghiniana]